MPIFSANHHGPACATEFSPRVLIKAPKLLKSLEAQVSLMWPVSSMDTEMYIKALSLHSQDTEMGTEMPLKAPALTKLLVTKGTLIGLVPSMLTEMCLKMIASTKLFEAELTLIELVSSMNTEMFLKVPSFTKQFVT